MANAAVITLSGSGAAIPDNNVTGLTFDLATIDVRNVTNVELFLTDISHTWIGDLVVTLEHVGVAGPVTVLSRLGNSTNPITGCTTTVGCSANLVTGGTYTFATTGTTLGSVANMNVSTTNIPFATYVSLNSLAPLNGAAANGTWRLFISDNASQDVTNPGWTWGVNLTVDDATVPEPSTFGMLGLALAGISYRLRRHRWAANQGKPSGFAGLSIARLTL